MANGSGKGDSTIEVRKRSVGTLRQRNRTERRDGPTTRSHFRLRAAGPVSSSVQLFDARFARVVVKLHG